MTPYWTIKLGLPQAGVASGNWLDISWWMVSSCVVHHLYILIIYLLLLLLFSLPFLSCIMVFSSIHRFLFFFIPHSLSHPTESWRVSKQLHGAELPAGLNYNRPFGAQHGAQRVEITTDLTGACKHKFVTILIFLIFKFRCVAPYLLYIKVIILLYCIILVCALIKLPVVRLIWVL